MEAKELHELIYHESCEYAMKVCEEVDLKPEDYAVTIADSYVDGYKACMIEMSNEQHEEAIKDVRKKTIEKVCNLMKKNISSYLGLFVEHKTDENGRETVTIMPSLDMRFYEDMGKIANGED